MELQPITDTYRVIKTRITELVMGETVQADVRLEEETERMATPEELEQLHESDRQVND